MSVGGHDPRKSGEHNIIFIIPHLLAVIDFLIYIAAEVSESLQANSHSLSSLYQRAKLRCRFGFHSSQWPLQQPPATFYINTGTS